MSINQELKISLLSLSIETNDYSIFMKSPHKSMKNVCSEPMNKRDSQRHLVAN